MFAIFNLGVQELIILAVFALVPLGILLAYLLGAFGPKDRRED